jgi:glucosamine-6-phosphate deaminase
MRIVISEQYDEMSRIGAQIVARTINAKPNAVLGLATGSTPLGLYRELVRMHQEDGLDFSRVTTFNLDEYVGLSRDHAQSYHYFMHENLFRHLNIPEPNIHIPSGTTDNYSAFCEWYEERIEEVGGIDLQLLGIGADGHIAFNEPTSSLGSRTRIKTLAPQTIQDNARFFEKPEDVPIYAITMGVGTIMDARNVLMVINGRHKSAAAAAAIEGPVTSMCTASALQMHPHCTVLLDREATRSLTMLDYYEFVQQHNPGSPYRKHSDEGPAFG